MKLEYSHNIIGNELIREGSGYENSNIVMLKFFLSQLFILLTIFSIFAAGMHIKNFLGVFTPVVVIVTIILAIDYIYFIVQSEKIYKKELWKNGEKKIGTIIDAYEGKINTAYLKYNNSLRRYDYIPCISVAYDKTKKIKVKGIKENEAFKILKLLLDQYPIKVKVEIPVDVYVYKKRVYVDIDSVELSKVKGYEEAKAIVDKNEY